MTRAPDGVGTGGGYGSHQPALRALARFIPIRSVIEFGAGVFSTHLFLDPDAFPDLTSLVTFEHNQKWIDDIRVDDKRHRIITAPPESLVKASDGMKADFVFLDNAPMLTRLGLAKHALRIGRVIGMHDVAVADLKNALDEDVPYFVGFKSKILTAFASNTIDVSRLTLGESA